MFILMSCILILMFNFSNMLIFMLMFLNLFMIDLSGLFLIDKFILNNMCMLMIMLTFWIFMAVLLNSYMKSYMNIFMIKMSMIFSLIFFLSNNLMNFYIFFELNLLPVFVLLMNSGSDKERLKSMIYIFMFTIFGSFPLLSMFMSFKQESLNSLLNLSFNCYNLNEFLIFVLLAPFLIKFPLFGVHMWLPEAHVESPVEGSVILAGIMMKLGLYALWQMFFYLNKSYYMILILSILSLFGSMYSSIICISQTDLKSLIAFSSMAHMGVSYVALMGKKSLSLYSSVSLAWSHTFTSSGLFFMASFIYMRINSRSINFMSGFSSMSANLTIWLVLLLVCNMSVPFSLSMVGEIMAFSSIIFLSYLLSILLMISSMMISFYNIIILSKICFFKSKETMLLKSLNLKENCLMFMVITPLIFMLLMIDWFIY